MSVIRPFVFVFYMGDGHNHPTFVGTEVVLTHFLETRLPLETFLLEKLSQEWLGVEAFIPMRRSGGMWFWTHRDYGDELKRKELDIS